MARLTDTQRIVLSSAAARDDGLAEIPAKMNKAAASKVGSSLVARKLMREVKSKPGMPVWREDKDGRLISLTLTKVGRDAVGVEENSDQRAPVAAVREKAAKHLTWDKSPMAVNANASSSTAAPPRAGSKQALVIGMLSGKRGVTLDALAEATGWLPHTTRAALTGLRKRGYSIERSRTDGGESVYRIDDASASTAA